jgi:Ca2+-binding RTX toxin-like protein
MPIIGEQPPVDERPAEALKIKATFGDDLLVGDAGNDTISSCKSNDIVSGGGGNDYIRSEAGNNKITSGSGDDIVRTDAGADRVDAGAGDDFVFATSDYTLLDLDVIRDFRGGEDQLLISDDFNIALSGSERKSTFLTLEDGEQNIAGSIQVFARDFDLERDVDQMKQADLLALDLFAYVL